MRGDVRKGIRYRVSCARPSPGRSRPTWAVGLGLLTALILLGGPAHAAPSLRFDPGEAAPGDKVVVRTMGSFPDHRGERVPLVLHDGALRERVGVLEFNAARKATLRFRVPRTLPSGEYEATVGGKILGHFTVLDPPGPPFPRPPAQLWGLAGVVAAGVAISKVRGRARSPRKSTPVALRSNLDELALGGLVTSPTLGLGDLGWGSWKRGVYLPRPRLPLHILLGGATGSGKSTSVDRIEFEAARTYAPQIIHFDCKGRRGGAERFMALMLGAKYSDMDIRVAPLEPYDGWRGDRPAHLNRLLAIQDFSDAQPFYTAATKDLLQRSLAESAVLPRMSGEFLERLVRDHPGIDPKVASGTIARYRGFFGSLGGVLDGSWAFDDVEACYIELPGMARREDAVAYSRYLLEDFMHYIAERKDPEREVLLVLDDFSAISSGQEAVNLIERAREFNVGVILTTQSYAGLGPGAERIIDACNGALIVHRMSNPEPFISRAGTVWRQQTAVTQPARQPGIISAVLLNHEYEMPRHTTRAAEFPRIDPNEARSLPPGDAFVIADGKAQRIAVAEVHELHQQVGELYPEITHDPRVSGLTLLELGREVLELRRKTYADLHEPPPANGTPPPPTDDPDLDF